MKFLNVQEYLLFLQSKGFHLKEDVKGFIFYGQHLTNSSDALVILAIEATLKAQKRFDGSLFISILEELEINKIKSVSVAKKVLSQKLNITL